MAVAISLAALPIADLAIAPPSCPAALAGACIPVTADMIALLIFNPAQEERTKNNIGKTIYIVPMMK